MANKAGHRGFGRIRQLPSKRYQASYVGPDNQRHNAPETFRARIDAEGWLTAEHRLTEDPATWTPPAARLEAARAAAERQSLTFAEYAAQWVDGRMVRGRPLAARSRDYYRSLLRDHINPTFGDVSLDRITPEAVNTWYATLAPGHATTRGNAYSLFRSIMLTATSVHGPLVGHVNPAAVRGGGSVHRETRTKVATSAELAIIVETMRPDRRLAVLLACWCQLRFGELAELRRADVDVDKAVIHVRRSVARSTEAGVHVKTPKSEAGSRDVSIPSHVVPVVREHLSTYAPKRNDLLFPGADGQHLAPSTFYGRPDVYDDAGNLTRRGHGWYRARQAAGREDLRFHDLRHTGAVLAAQAGATLAELMERLGHSTSAAALRYQHAAENRQQVIADRLAALAEAGEW